MTDDWIGMARTVADWSVLDRRADVQVFAAPFVSQDEAAETLSGFDIILPMRERLSFDRSLLERLPNLKMLALTGFHCPHVDLAYCAENGVTVCGSGQYSPAATAELTLGLILAAQRDIVRGDTAIRAGRFQQSLALGEVLEGRTLGIIGLGRIGTRVAIYGQALGMDVIAWSPNLTEDRCAAAHVRSALRDELLAASDVVSLHLQHRPSTPAVIGRDELAQMKPGALLVNTARSGLVDTTALVTALQEGRVRAAIDVFDEEPRVQDSPLLKVKGTVLSPHLGFSARPGFPLFYSQSIENILAFLDREPIRQIAPLSTMQ